MPVAQTIENASEAMQVFYPSTLKHNAAVFIVRGGDWRNGNSQRVLHPLAAAFAENGFPAVVADYPPDAADAFEQLASLRRSYQEFRLHLASCGMKDPQILVFGMGAGAHLGALLTCAAPGECGEKITFSGEWAVPAAGCFLSCPIQFTPWPELFPRTWSNMQKIAGSEYAPGNKVYERLSVKTYLKGKVPPLFFAEGEQDHVDTAAVSRKVCEEARQAGLPVQWQLYPLGGPSFMGHFQWKPSVMLFADMLRFFEENAGKGAVPQSIFPQPNGNYCVYSDTPVQQMRGVDIFLPPEGMEVLPTAFFMVHGGGWRAGDRTKFTAIAEEFARRGVVTASAGYRTMAHDAFEQLADVRSAYEAFVLELERLGRPLNIVVYGESAGAHLASLLAVAAPGECGEKITLRRQWVKPAAMILQSAPSQFIPWEDIEPSILYSMEEIAGAPYEVDPKRFERLSMDHYLEADMPPAFFSEAEFEVVFPVQMIRDLAAEMQKLGVPAKVKRYQQAEHGFFYALSLPVQKEFFEDILEYLRALPALKAKKTVVE